MILIVMGVSGSGKTSVGKLLAKRVGYRFVDADDYHSAANVTKMESGKPLTDDDRQEWLQALRDVLMKAQDRIVLACSALKQAYRDRLVVSENVRFVYLKVDEKTVKARFEKRKGHFMNAALIASQFETMEEPEDAITIDATSTPESAVDEVIAALSRDFGP